MSRNTVSGGSSIRPGSSAAEVGLPASATRAYVRPAAAFQDVTATPAEAKLRAIFSRSRGASTPSYRRLANRFKLFLKIGAACPPMVPPKKTRGFSHP
jgi:hypothetical protein